MPLPSSRCANAVSHTDHCPSITYLKKILFTVCLFTVCNIRDLTSVVCSLAHYFIFSFAYVRSQFYASEHDLHPHRIQESRLVAEWLTVPEHETPKFDALPRGTGVRRCPESRMWHCSRVLIQLGIEALDKQGFVRLQLIRIIPLVLGIVHRSPYFRKWQG